MSFRFTPGRVAVATAAAAVVALTGTAYVWHLEARAAADGIIACQDNLAPSSKTPDPVIEMMNGVLVAEFTPTQDGVAVMGAAEGRPLCTAKVRAGQRVVLTTPLNGALRPWWMDAGDVFLRIG